MTRLHLGTKAIVAAACAILFQVTSLISAAQALDASPLVSVEWLETNQDDENLLVLDIRSPLAKSGKDDYLKGHIPGAVWSEYPGFWRTSRGIFAYCSCGYDRSFHWKGRQRSRNL